MFPKQRPAQIRQGCMDELILKRRPGSFVSVKNEFGFGRIPQEIFHPMRLPEQFLYVIGSDVRRRENIPAFADQPMARNRGLAV